MTDCNIQNRTIFCDDNIDVLRGVNFECIDLICLDPPFNKNKKLTARSAAVQRERSFQTYFERKM